MRGVPCVTLALARERAAHSRWSNRSPMFAPPPWILSTVQVLQVEQVYPTSTPRILRRSLCTQNPDPHAASLRVLASHTRAAGEDTDRHASRAADGRSTRQSHAMG